MTGPKNALAAWGSSALRPVELPSGTRMLVKLPDVLDLLRHDRLPAELRELAFRYAQAGIEITSLSPEDLVQFVDFTYELTARLVKYIAPPDSQAWDAFRLTGESPTAEGWEPVSISAGELREMDIDQADLDALGRIAGRQATTNEITALSRFDRGLISADDMKERIAADPDGRVGDFAPFRGEPDGAAGGADREDVREAPERSPSRVRPRARVRGRRSPSA
jgi:hypothetical protein